MPDYSQQLRDIAAALNRPQTPAWGIAIAAALIGFFGAVGAQMLRRIFDEWRDLRQVQRVVYSGLAGLFFALDNMQGARSEREAREELAAARHFDTDEFLKHEYRLFMQMPERYIVNDIYLELRKLSDAPNSVRARATHLMNLIAINIANNRFDPKLFRRALKKREAEIFLRRAGETVEPILQRAQASSSEHRLPPLN